LKHIVVRLFLLTLLISIPLITLSMIVKNISAFRAFDKVEQNKLEKHTINGNKYRHDFRNLHVENGHWVGLYHCDEELEREWNKVSAIPFDSLDRRGQKIRHTIARYMTSLNLRKDSAGVSALAPEDIQMIEKGYSNYIFKNKLSFKPRLYEVIWEIDLYRRGGSPAGHSVAQRMEYMKAAFGIIQNHFWFGTGTGDVQASFYKQYAKMGTMLSVHKQHRAHNQFVSFFVAFGFVGFIFISIAMIYPVWYRRKELSYLFLIVFAVSMVSMLNEDTLETQAGVTFFTFFYSLFIFRNG
jgi:hypothetical protein